ncbi:MAG: hypothetical protein JXR91_15775 [Deltaproteobacteria bacterium]|nr:hypothetical protein [Deltaproteobacteria bacterium]
MNKNLIFIVAIILFSTNSYAKTFAVLPVNYVDANSGEADINGAKQVLEYVKKALTESGYTPVDAALPSNLAKTDDCNKECLIQIAKEMHSEDAISVKIEDSDQITYSANIIFAKRESISAETSDAYFVFLEWIKFEVIKAVLVPAVEKENTAVITTDSSEKSAGDSNTTDPDENSDSADESKENSVSGNEIKPDESSQNNKNSTSDKKKLGKLPFFITAGTTVAFGITTLIIDSASDSKFESVKSDALNRIKSASEIRDEVDSINHLNSARNVFLSFTIAGLVATGVLAIFTDFKKDKKTTESKLKLSPVIAGTDKSGFFILNGSF